MSLILLLIKMDTPGKSNIGTPGKSNIGTPGKDNSYKLYKECARYEDFVLFIFFANLILLWLFFTLYFVLGYLEIDIN